MSKNPVNLRGSNTTAAVDKATKILSPGGTKITPKEWAAIQKAVDEDIYSAHFLPIGAPLPTTPLMKAMADTAILIQKSLVLGSLEKTKDAILDVLSGIGPKTAKQVAELGKSERTLSPGDDKNVAAIMEKLDKAIALQNADRNKFIDAVKENAPTPPLRTLQQIETELKDIAARAGKTFKLGND
jgi:hypothetical protein